MSQSKVTSYYATRKNTRRLNKIDTSELTKNVTTLSEDFVTIKSEVKRKNAKEKTKINYIEKSPDSHVSVAEPRCESSKVQMKQKTVKKVPKTTKSSRKNIKAPTLLEVIHQPKVTNFYESLSKCSDENKIFEKEIDTTVHNEEYVKSSTTITCSTKNTQILDERGFTKNFENNEIVEEQSKEKDLEGCSESKFTGSHAIFQSPKRNIINSNEGTPPKKKCVSEKINQQSHSRNLKVTPRKLFLEIKDEQTSETCISSPDKVKKIIPCNKSEETKKAIENFKKKLSVVKKFESNTYKITSVISPSQKKEIKPTIEVIPSYKKFSYLVDKEISSSLTLPFKYKLLLEMFRSMDTVVCILYNRKEQITFEKVTEGVQKMMKRNFSRTYLGQIVTVMPSAFEITLQKCSFKNVKDPSYQLVISPNLSADTDFNKKVKSKKHIPMTPQNLLDRKKEFSDLLLNLVKNHHTIFLSKLNFPQVPTDSIKRWHPKFQVDSIPDIDVASLPEVPETKIYTAKDVLNKVIKGPMRGKVVNALKSVAEESATPSKTIELLPVSNEPKLPASKSALKGVCSDLIAKIRARESAKLLECMTESPDEVKRKAMLERIPKIVQILWHYFIAERKAAVPVDIAVEKVIHSFNSLSTHEEVKAHLKLITETFPGWLSFIQIPKGLYITMDKNKNITKMLENFPS